MIIIRSNRTGVTELTATIIDMGKKPGSEEVVEIGRRYVTKQILGATPIDDPEFEEAILKDPDFIKWTTQKTLKPGKHHLDKGRATHCLYEVDKAEAKKAVTGAGDESPYRFMETATLIENIAMFTDLDELQKIKDMDGRGEVTRAARDRIKEIKKPKSTAA